MTKKKESNSLRAPLSSEHNQLLELCSHIRQGLIKDVDKARIRAYTDWFKKECLEPHFKMEEEHIFPLLGSTVRVKKALANHRRIKKLLSCDCDNERVLNLLEEELAAYVRFEERVLFKELGENHPADLVEMLHKKHDALEFSEAKWEDKFWE